MSATMLVLYGTPTDPTAFDARYARHVPLAQKVPGLRSFEVSRGPIKPALVIARGNGA